MRDRPIFRAGDNGRAGDWSGEHYSMPIFELDAGRPVLVRPLQPAADTFGAETSSVVANHLGSLLGEQLFPVATRQHGADGPHLLAVDAAGQPVVVEVVQMLDSEALVRALRFAGTAARMSSADLARAYHAGPERFATELVAFRENVPVAVAHAAARRGGARLLLVCSEVAENLVDVVEFLRQSGRQVQVLQVGVLQGADGRRYVDVSPLVPQVPTRRAVEPSALHPVGATEALESEPTTAPTPLVAHAPAGHAPAGHGAAGRGRRTAGPAGPSGPGHGGAHRPDVRPAGHHDSPAAGAEHASGARVAPTSGPIPVSSGPVPSAGAAAPGGTFPSVLPVPVGPAPAGTPTPDPMLAAVAAELATTTTLVWSRQRRGQRFVATLRVDGLIQLPDGAVFAEPDAAAAAVAGSEYSIDGWRVWRMGDDGPTLSEVRSA